MAKIVFGRKYIFSIRELMASFWYTKRNNNIPNIRLRNEGEYEYFYVPICGRREKFYIKKRTIKLVELIAIYIETFYEPKINGHSYMHEEVAIREGDIVIDAGACEGFFVRHALNRGARLVVALEPCKELRDGLEKTFCKEIASRQVVILPYALGRRKSKGKLSINKEQICSSTTEVSEKSGKKVEIEIDSLDNIIKELRLARVDLVKMDIEGAEIDAMRGAKKTLKKYRPKFIVATYHEYENAVRVRNICKKCRDDYSVRMYGCYSFEKPFRPYLTLLF